MTGNADLWDCLVVGGGAAGTSAALTLGRARRRTLVVDAGRPSNRSAAAIAGLVGYDGRSPAEFRAAAGADLAAYPSIARREGEAVRATRDDDGAFTVVLGDGSSERARALVLAPGMRYSFPQLPGMAERWGGPVFHCPFCHGWEVRDRALGVLATGDVGVHGALNLRAWSDRITLLTNGVRLTDLQRERLAAGGVAWDERPVAALDGPGAELRSVVFADGAQTAVEALLVKAFLYQRSPLAAELGVTLVEPDEMLGVEAIVVDAMFRTGVPGVYAAGDAATSVPPSMAAAMASGYLAGASAVVALAAGY